MIHVLDNDPRQYTDKDNYALNHGSFSEVAIQLNKALDELGLYAEPDKAEYVGICDGLNVGFKYKDKKSFVIHVWEATSLPAMVFQMGQNQRIFGLSNQITNLWHKYGRTDVKTVYGGCDTSFWKPTVPKNPNKFQFCHVNSSNVRSGLDLTLRAFVEAFSGQDDVKLIVKDTNPQTYPLLPTVIDEFKKLFKVDIDYISNREPATYIRDLYSASHVTLNVLRATSFGMPILDSAACGSCCVTGDIAPTNELIHEPHGVLVPSAGEEYLQDIIPTLVRDWGLLNCYGNFSYLEKPAFHKFDPQVYAKILSNIKATYSNFLNNEARNYIIENWGWKRSALDLYNNLYGK